MSSTIDVPLESSNVTKRKAVLRAVRGWKKGIVIMDIILRLGAILACLGAAVIMGILTDDEPLPFLTHIFQIEASYDSFPAFKIFVITMAIVGGYLALSLPFSMVTIACPHALWLRLLLTILDTVFLTLATSSAAAAAAIAYLAHNGNPNWYWPSACNEFGHFCEAISEAVMASFVAVVVFVLLIVMSALALRNTLASYNYKIVHRGL